MMSPRSTLAEAAQTSGAESRRRRRNQIDRFRHRVRDWLSEFDRREQGGPASEEMGKVIEDLEAHLTKIRQDED